MEDKGVLREGEFVFKIPDFWEEIEEVIISPDFSFGKYDCHLQLHEDTFDDEETKCCTVWFCGPDSVSIDYNAFFNLSLINGHEEEFVSAKRIALKSPNCFLLMKIWYSDLTCKDNYLLPDDVLTLRLSWCDKKNMCEQDTQASSNLNSEEESSKLLQTLSNDFVCFYENKQETNFVLRVGKTNIPVHSVVLSARSEVFATMFRQGISENRSVVDIPDVDASILSDVLYYVYSGQTRGMSADRIVPMYKVAERYALIELKDVCLNVLMRSLTVENVCDAGLLAHNHEEKELEEKIVQFVKEKGEEIEQTQAWKELLKSEPALSRKLRRLV